MWRSVPQMDATFTFTSTSVGPIFGIATSRISVPGLGSGFTTASMVSGIQDFHLWSLFATELKQQTPDFSTKELSLRASWSRAEAASVVPLRCLQSIEPGGCTKMQRKLP